MQPFCLECKCLIPDDGEVMCDACHAAASAEQDLADNLLPAPAATSVSGGAGAELLNEYPMPEYHAEGMGCGLEDRGVTDRYEAMQYGWNEAIQRVENEVIAPLLAALAASPASVTSPQNQLDGLPEGEYHLSDLENRLYKPFGETGLPLDDANLLDHVCQYARRLQRAATVTSPVEPAAASTPVGGASLDTNKVADWLLDFVPGYWEDEKDEDKRKVLAFAYAEDLIEKSAALPIGVQAGGAALIAAERAEQIHKHGFDVKNDVDYGRGELVQAAATCLSLYATGPMADIAVGGEYNQRKMWPWQSEFGMTYYAKIWAKSDVDKLKVAGALIAAEIDRLQALAAPTA